MTKVSLPLLLLILAMSLPSLAQTPAYTQSTSFACNQETCNGLPLDQGGQWQFILANQAFSISCNGFVIHGNPGNPGSGGISAVQDNIPEPATPYPNGSLGAEGSLTFNWAAVNSDRSLHYTGHVLLYGHEVRHCYLHGCWDQMIVDDARIYIDTVN